MENRFAGLVATLIAFPLMLAASLAMSTRGYSAAPVPEASASVASHPAAPHSAAPSPASPSHSSADGPTGLKGNEINILYTTNIIGEIDPCG